MIRDPNAPLPDPIPDDPTVPRVFLREPGWQVGLKVGSLREFCHTIAPGDDSYHRLADGELFVHSAEERLCLPCAERRGLLHFEPKQLGKARDLAQLDALAEPGDTFQVIDPDADADADADPHRD